MARLFNSFTLFSPRLFFFENPSGRNLPAKNGRNRSAGSCRLENPEGFCRRTLTEDCQNAACIDYFLMPSLLISARYSSMSFLLT